MTTGPRRRGRPPGSTLDVAERREALLDAAETAIREHGPDVGLSTIAAAAGLTRSAVYAVFADRGALIEALNHRHVTAILTRIQAIIIEVAAPREQVRASIDVLAGWFEDHPEMSRLLRDGATGTDNPERTRIVTAFAAVLGAGFTARGLDPAPSHTWARATVGAITATLPWWVRERPMPREVLVEELTDLIWGGYGGAEPTDR